MIKGSTKEQAGLKIYAIYNPVAGANNVENIVRRLSERAKEHGTACEIHEWQEDEDLQLQIEQALQNGCQRFVAIGGDGTFSRVASSLVSRQIPIAFIPAGSTNVIARDLGIPLQVNRAIQLCLTGTNTRRIDAMQVGDSFHFMNISVGLSADAVQKTKQQEKRRMAWLAYIFSGLAQLSGANLKRFQLTLDGKRVQVRASEVHITNIGLFGFEPFRWDERVRPDDGNLEIHVVRARTLTDYFQLGVNMVLRRSRKSRSLHSYRAENSIRIESEKPLPVQGDGDLIGKTPIEINLMPGAIRVIVPENN